MGASPVRAERAAQEALSDDVIQAQKLQTLGRLAAGVAHDLNNMLTSVICFARFVADDLSPDDPHRADLIEVLRAADSASQLTKQLVAFSRRKAEAPVSLEVGTTLRSVERLLRRTLGEKIELALTLPSQPLAVVIDASYFEQLIYNLALNARDAMPAGGKLSIAVSTRPVAGDPYLSDGEHVELTVADTGVGMAEDVAQRVFEPFFTTKDGTGTGLGLATCRGIVEHSGGSISLRSAPGAGTTFTVLLPRATARAEERDPRSVELQGPALLGTALVVDDQVTVTSTIARALRDAGMNVLEAQNGEDALALLEASPRPITLLVADVILPGITGVQLAEHLGERSAELKVLFISGYEAEPPRPSPRLQGRTAYLPKPFDARKLVRRAARLLRETPAGR